MEEADEDLFKCIKERDGRQWQICHRQGHHDHYAHRIHIYSTVKDDPCTATTTHFEFPTLQKATEKEERLAAEQVVVNTPR